MRLHGVLADHQTSGDLGVGQAAGHEDQHFGLPRGQAGQLGHRLGLVAALPGELADQPPGHLGGQ